MSSALRIYLQSVGLAADGLPNWDGSQSILQGQQALPTPDPSQPWKPPAPTALPRNERRRATPITRLAFAACEDALRESSPALRANLRSVFASCSGDLDVVDNICRGLCADTIALSPMQFHNSVHNACAGYWSIASGSRAPSVSLSAFEGTAAAGLLEAALQLADQPDSPLLLVIYDVATKPPLFASRPIPQAFACAFLLSADGGAENTALEMSWLDESAQESRLPEPLESLRLSNPAARSLPLLHALANQETTQIILPAAQGQLAVSIVQ